MSERAITMELRQLDYFLACCEHGTFTAAARSMQVVQSAVSTSVAKLEREVGAQLFDRTPTTLVLTEAGRAVVEPARAAVRARAEIVDALAALRGDIRGDVAVGALVNIVTIDLAEAFGAVHRRHPGVAIAMRQNPQGSQGNIRGLRDGTLDLALLGGLDQEIPGITVYRLAREPLVLVAHPDHRLVRAGGFAAADLAAERTIDYPPGWGTRAVTDKWLPHRRSVIEVADQEFGIRLALNDFGVTLVPWSVAHDHAGAVGVPCTDRDLDWVVSIAHSSVRSPSTAARAVLDIVREVTTRTA
ncbi:LysR family transcriptional regulator [Gordonia polyisoprenivorans]|uniref:LysR family transcriptional regulator n=1 Tax=Gordonia polyisoprenivorans TaxID=84595 RepID=UPI00201349D8|nr:LysR family transcriptional regulator [Gordonia polyisoprenivorans]